MTEPALDELFGVRGNGKHSNHSAIKNGPKDGSVCYLNLDITP
jgi:hypothetical protein